MTAQYSADQRISLMEAIDDILDSESFDELNKKFEYYCGPCTYGQPYTPNVTKKDTPQ